MAQGPHNLNIEGNVFLVTGGAAGIGARLVKSLLIENARHVAFLDISEREGVNLENEILHRFGALKAKFIKCDISDEAQLTAAYKQVMDKYRRLDCVINNAAVLSADDHDFKKMIDTNFTATVSSTIKALDIMGADKGGNGGTVVNISSLLALKHSTHLPVYTATKTAVLQFSNSLGTAENFEKTKVRVLTVCLGPTDTAIITRQHSDNSDKDCTVCLTSRAPERQRVESATRGIIKVINMCATGSTWMVANDKPAVDISDTVCEGFKVLCKDIHIEYL